MTQHQATRLAQWVDLHARPMPTRINQDGTITIYSHVSDGTIDAEVAASIDDARLILGY